MYPIKIKAGAISHLTDARYFAARDVSWLGFSLNATDPQAMTNRQVAAIREWVDGPGICGEFDLAPAEDILTVAAALALTSITSLTAMPYFVYSLPRFIMAFRLRSVSAVEVFMSP